MANVVLLMSDEHNPFFSSVYGHPFLQTPNMDRLAREGTWFKTCYCPSPLCLPSRSAVMSGKRVHQIQAYSNCNVNLNPNFVSYGQVLKEQGVHSVYVGKTDVYDVGANLGFSEMILPGDRALPGDVNFMRRPLEIRAGAADRANGFGVREDAFDDDNEVVAAAVEWLSSRASTIDRPWTLTINLLNPHFPQWNTQAYWDQYPEAGDLPPYARKCESANHPYAVDLRSHFEADQFTEAQTRGIRRGYCGNVSYVDAQIGAILDVLQRTGQLENTNFIYTSDHGDMLGKFGLWWKCSLYEDSVRVPCLAIGPDFTPGTIVNTAVDLLDVQATLFKSVGASRPDDWEGEPLQGIPMNDPERVVFSEYHGHGTRAGAYMIRKGDWKLIYYMEAPHQLFEISRDPDELHNVYSVNPDKAEELERELRKICSPQTEDERAHAFQDGQRLALQRGDFSQPKEGMGS